MTAFKDRTGERRLMNHGEYCTITKYINAMNMTVVFDNGVEKSGVSYRSFSKGLLCSGKHISLVGKTYIGKDGIEGRVIYDWGHDNIDVLLSDNTVLLGVRRSDIKEGSFGVTSRRRVYIVGEGLYSYKIDGHTYTGSIDEIRSIVINTREIRGKNRVGVRLKMNNGMYAMCVEYISSKNITIVFENGEERRGVLWGNFITGQVDNSRVGRISTMSNGEVAKILNYHCSGDIDIEYSDGVVRLGVKMLHFKEGSVSKNKGALYPAYTFRGVKYYKCEYKGVRYLGTIEEIRSQLGLGD